MKKVYKSSLPEAPLIIDGGANIGLSIFFFKRFYPKAKIIGFEPNPKSFELLKKNISVNNLRNVNLYNSALDINAKTISFFISSNMTDDDIGPSTNLRHVKDFHENKGSIQEITVPCTKLSQFINSDVDLLKLDIEGSESNVIQDLSKIFNKIKLLIIEYHYHSGQKTNPLSKIIDVIERHGYEYVIEGRRKMKFKKSRNFIIKTRPPL